MANRFARKTGNWNASDVWSDTPSGTAGAEFIPTTGDVAMANSFTVTINVDATCAEVRNDATGGATASGGFTLASGITLTANCYAGTTTCVTFSANAPDVGYIVGNSYAGSVNTAHGCANTGAGTLTITGNAGPGGTVSSGGANYFGCVVNKSSGALILTGTSKGSANNACPGSVNFLSGSVTITGDVIGNTGPNSCGVFNAGTGSFTITGNATGGEGSSAYGAINNSTGTLTVLGLAISNNYPNDGIINATVGVYNTNANGIFYIGGIKCGTGGYVPLAGAGAGAKFFFASGGIRESYLYDNNQGNLINLNNTTLDHPAESNVRAGVTYYQGTLTGTCHVPGPASVLHGVPVDNTTGTAALSQADIAEVFGAFWAQGDA